MTLVAIYYSPPSANSASSKVKTTTINSNFTSKWKKGIALLSSKYSHKRKYQCSPTTIAAATEKVLCHSKNNSPPHHNHIKCEDLTAKEFAKMAGIKIKSDDEDDEVDAAAEGDDEMIDFVSVTATTAPAQQHYLSIVDEPMTTQMTSVSTRTALSSKSCHQIWDSDFWQCNDNSNNNNNNKLMKTNTNTTANTAKTNTNNNNNDTLFISRLRSCSSSVENSNNMTVPGVIQKGRFKIVVGQDDCCEPVTQHHHVVLEWKRKRSDSSSTNLTTKKKQPM